MKRGASCECGQPRRRINARMFGETCERCAILDGETLPESARALISELRHLGRASWDTLLLEMAGQNRRTLYRAIAVLRRIGRLATHETIDERPGTGWNRKRRNAVTVVLFELREA